MTADVSVSLLFMLCDEVHRHLGEDGFLQRKVWHEDQGLQDGKGETAIQSFVSQTMPGCLG